MKKLSSLVIGLSLMLVFVLGAANVGTAAPEASTQDRGSVEIGYVQWAGEIAATNVMKLVLEEAGWDVTITAVDVAPLYLGVANGDFDFTVSAWLPDTQATYWQDDYEDKIDYVRSNLEGCRIGLVVPDYMTDVTTIEDLADTDLTEITGIDAGAGIMTNTEEAITEYELDLTLQASSGAGMTAALASAYDSEEEIVVTLWSPHWTFDAYDLHYLEDSKGVFGTADHVATLARPGLAYEDSALYSVLENFHWEQSEIQGVMYEVAQNDKDPAVAAQDFIDANSDLVDSWLADVDSPGTYEEDSQVYIDDNPVFYEEATEEEDSPGFTLPLIFAGIVTTTIFVNKKRKR